MADADDRDPPAPPERSYLGTGWAFPPRLDARGRIALAHEERTVEEAIRVILLTRKGERVMRPEFGSDLHRLQFAPLDSATGALAARYVREALERWEPRVSDLEVEAATDPAREGCLRIEIRYRLHGQPAERSLVFPFYVIPGGE